MSIEEYASHKHICYTIIITLPRFIFNLTIHNTQKNHTHLAIQQVSEIISGIRYPSHSQPVILTYRLKTQVIPISHPHHPKPNQYQETKENKNYQKQQLHPSRKMRYATKISSL